MQDKSQGKQEDESMSICTALALQRGGSLGTSSTALCLHPGSLVSAYSTLLNEGI